jgi:hypothetical protein
MPVASGGARCPVLIPFEPSGVTRVNTINMGHCEGVIATRYDGRHAPKGGMQ